jgi:syntaxin 7
VELYCSFINESYGESSGNCTGDARNQTAIVSIDNRFIANNCLTELIFRHQIRTYTQQLIKDTDASFKDIVNCKDRHLKIQRDRLVDEFTAALTAFQAVQKKTVDLEKNAVRQAKANVTIPKPPSSNKSTSNSFGDSPFENNFVDNRGPTQAQIQQEEIDLQALEDQERTIRELEENIVGVNEIYKKLGALVYEQGQTVDSIEASVENASVFVQDGTDQLRRASHYSVSLSTVTFNPIKITIFSLHTEPGA